MSYRTTNFAWKKLWPECVPDGDLEGFEANSGFSRQIQFVCDDSTMINDIVTIGQSTGLEVETDDIEELLEDHSIKLTTEELKRLQNEQEKKLADKIEEKEEDKFDVSSSLIIEMISKWIDLLNLEEKYHPDIVITNRTVNILNDNVMAHFKKILKHRQKQQTLDKFLSKRRTSPK